MGNTNNTAAAAAAAAAQAVGQATEASEENTAELLMLRLLLARLMADKNDSTNKEESNQRFITENETLHELYEEKSYIGQGAFGVVVKGKHFLDQSWNAIKVIGFDQHELGTVVREVRSLACLPAHKNVVSYRGCWIERTDKLKDNGLKEKLKACRGGRKVIPAFILCVRMECCAGNLDDYLGPRNRKFFTDDDYKSSKSLRDGRAFTARNHKNHKLIFIDILRGLNFLHEQGIIHRDLKPANILFDRVTKDFKINDFGLAKHVQAINTNMTLCGTPLYAAPEQMRPGGYDQRADIFSLGLILFEMVFPFKNGNDFSSTFSALKEWKIVPPGLKQQHPGIVMVMLAMIENDPDKRTNLQALLKCDWDKL